MNSSKRDRWHRLFSAAMDDRLTDEEQAELATLLGSSTEARHLWFVYHDNECALAERRSTPTVTSQATATMKPVHLRMLAASIACLLFGIGCASAIFAYFGPSLGKVTIIMQDSFESDAAPEVTGMPRTTRQWGGDYSRVTGNVLGISPVKGAQMLRFLRGDYEGRSLPDSHSSDVFRLFDIRPLRKEFADESGVVQLTAFFNAVASEPQSEAYGTLTIFALDAAAIVRPELSLSRDSIAYSRSSRLWLDSDLTSWQSVSNELRIPPDTDFLMIRIGMSYDIHRNPTPPQEFAGHFVDDVRFVFARRLKIPVP